MVLTLQSANSAVLIVKYLSRNKYIVYILLKKMNKLMEFFKVIFEKQLIYFPVGYMIKEEPDPECKSGQVIMMI